MTLLLFAGTATAEELCVNYVSETPSEPKEWAFTSFNPRTKESVVVARLASHPDNVKWQKDFKALSYEADGKVFQLEWKVGAAPMQVSKKPSPSPVKPQSPVKDWDVGSPGVVCDGPGKSKLDTFCTITVNIPANREIHTNEYEGCESIYFTAPVTWMDTQAGEEKLLYDTHDPNRLQVSTADNFVLVGCLNQVVADLSTGEVLLRAGDYSLDATWGNCPAK